MIVVFLRVDFELVVILRIVCLFGSVIGILFILILIDLFMDWLRFGGGCFLVGLMVILNIMGYYVNEMFNSVNGIV